jgi:hypothetical protein
MNSMPIFLNRDPQKVVGSIFLSQELLDIYLLDIYSETPYLVINPIVESTVDIPFRIIGFSINPPPIEPPHKPKKRGRPKKALMENEDSSEKKGKHG